MAKFRFYQDKEVKAWVRDYFTIEAETLEEAIKIVKDADCTLEDLEEKNSNVDFQYRVWDRMPDALCDSCDGQEVLGFSTFSCDLEDNCDDGEVVSKY